MGCGGVGQSNVGVKIKLKGQMGWSCCISKG